MFRFGSREIKRKTSICRATPNFDSYTYFPLKSEASLNITGSNMLGVFPLDVLGARSAGVGFTGFKHGARDTRVQGFYICLLLVSTSPSRKGTCEKDQPKIRKGQLLGA